MDAALLLPLLFACAPQVHAETASALVQVESGDNPWAIGVVGGLLDRQPREPGEALVTARALRQAGWNFSVGLAQINVTHLARLGLTLEQAFDPCINLAAMQTLLLDCFTRAEGSRADPRGQQPALRRALSCYYSGNFTTGLRQGYVGKVLRAADAQRSTASSNTAKESP